ncbi:NADPH-dependent FMN reductase [Komagataeibacter xylinus]|uniref:NAD(P)H-dependent oxidoreductase n=1 Tax=Komagataeibacter xylinus TaxID=28448 RepID=A0A857FSG9_KOMXY|nr:NADPH-dependent FMN reductase [Komagataeibacter xylinus]QHC37348.1 NAD(P)H-dependent oxidoreductase [Komagataeibacter xylinus]
MADELKHRILVIMGSVRAGRHCPVIAQWVAAIGQATTDLRIDVVDLMDWPLPMDDEPGLPAHGVYEHRHSRAWSETVAQADGFVFVSPQYNWGYPAALKNAIDHCYLEWKGKPLLIVTYGGHGGDKCAAQLRQVADGLKMRPVSPMPALTLSHDIIQSDAPVDDMTLQPGRASVEEGWRALVETLTDGQ